MKVCESFGILEYSLQSSELCLNMFNDKIWSFVKKSCNLLVHNSKKFQNNKSLSFSKTLNLTYGNLKDKSIYLKDCLFQLSLSNYKQIGWFCVLICKIMEFSFPLVFLLGALFSVGSAVPVYKYKKWYIKIQTVFILEKPRMGGFQHFHSRILVIL